MVHPHHARASQGDLMALARYWEWERTVEHELPRVIDETDIRIIFQPICRLFDGMPVVLGFEALSRFPVAPPIPAGVWFRTARELGLSRQLELTAIIAAIGALGRVSEEAFLCVNASLDTVPDLVEIVPERLGERLIIDVHYSAFPRPLTSEPFRLLRDLGARIAVDDVPLEGAHDLRPVLTELRPAFVKVDVLAGLADAAMARLELAECAAWCEKAGIELIAERVARLDDLEVLDKIGVRWAQGFCLAPPVAL